MIIAISPKICKFCAHLGLLPKKLSDGVLLSFLAIMLSNCVAVLAHSAQTPSHILPLRPALLSIALARPYNVANNRSTFPFCCGVFGASHFVAGYSVLPILLRGIWCGKLKNNFWEFILTVLFQILIFPSVVTTYFLHLY